MGDLSMSTTAVNGQSTQRHHVQGQENHPKKKVEGQHNQSSTLLSYNNPQQPHGVKPFKSDYDNRNGYGNTFSYFG